MVADNAGTWPPLVMGMQRWHIPRAGARHGVKMALWDSMDGHLIRNYIRVWSKPGQAPKSEVMCVDG